MILVSILLLLSGVTHFWNIIVFPYPDVDEGIYLGDAVKFMDTFNPKDPSGYFHPYFGPILLAGLLTITGYQSLLNSSEGLDYAMIYLIPRGFMAVLALVDTFLIYKIAELQYNRKVGFIAAALFAVMPSTWFTRWIHLDSIQLPFTLLSIFFILLYIRKNQIFCQLRQISLVLLSGIFLGLSIFTKIPSFTTIPLFGYLIFTQRKKNVKTFGLWLIPVLLIPLIWPLHSIYLMEFDEWLAGINLQTHREPLPFHITIQVLLFEDPFLVIFGIISLTYAILKRDMFIIFASVPFILFMILINWVATFHLTFLLVIFCISSSRLIVDIVLYLEKWKKKRIMQSVSLGGVSIILAFGLVSTIDKIIANDNSNYFEAAAYLQGYLKSEKASNESSDTGFGKDITVVSHPFFTWVQRYKFHEDNYVPYLMIEKHLAFKTNKIITINDSGFNFEMKAPDGLDIGTRFGKLFSAFDTKVITSFNGSSDDQRIEVLLTNLERPNPKVLNELDLLNTTNDWKNSRDVVIKRDGGTLNITSDNNLSGNTDKVNTAYLKTPLNLTGSPLFLSVVHFTGADLDKKLTFYFELRDSDSKLLWNSRFEPSHHEKQGELHVISNVPEKQAFLNIKLRTTDNGAHNLMLDKLKLFTWKTQ